MQGVAMRESTQGRGRRRSPIGATSPAMTVIAALALVVAACGDPALDTGAVEAGEAEEPVDEAPVESEETPEEPPPAPAEAEPAEQPAEVAEEDAPDDEAAACVLPIGDGTPMDGESYEDLVMPINGALEELAYEMDAALADLEGGTSDGPSLRMELEQYAEAWDDLAAPVVGLSPPSGAEDWHDRLVESWVLVCEAIQDGIHGLEDGDEDRFEDFVGALRDFPSLVNHLHANAACGPFESC
jgi:hypothetical protein